MGSAPSSDNKKLSTVASTKSSSTKSFDPTSTSNVSATNNNTKLHRGIKSQRTSKERIAAAREAVADSRDTGEFHNICMSVFENADRDNDGNLSRAEFFSVMLSSSLGLNLSNKEVEDVYLLADGDGDGLISYKEFIPVLKKVLRTVYQRTTLDWNDWCQIGTNKHGKVLFLNKRTGEITTTMPDNFNPERKELHTFEYITLPDGTEITTYVDDGQRFYLNWEDEKWMPFPEEWAKALHGPTAATDAERLDAAQDHQDRFDSEPAEEVQQFSYYDHPTRGRLQTYFFENTRHTRLYYDSVAQDWNRMPLFWECNIPEVKEMLQAIDEALPTWRNVNEQLLVLREVDYIVEDAILFAEINFRELTEPVQDTSDKPPSASRRSMVRRQSKIFPRQSSQFLSAIGEDASIEAVPISAANRIHDLEMQVSARDKQIHELSSQVQGENVGSFARELSVNHSSVQKLSKELTECQTRVYQLQAKIEEQQATIASQQQQLLIATSTQGRVTELEQQLTSIQSGQQDDFKALLETTRSQLDVIRKENLTLKAQSQQQQSETKNPFKIPSVTKVLRFQHDHLKAINTARIELLADVQQQSTELKLHIFNTKLALSKLKASFDVQLEDITSKYRAESLQRKLLYNKVQELKGNIRVFCRCRFDARDTTVFQFPSSTELLVPSINGSAPKIIEFDRVYDPDTKQETVFEDTKATILSVVDGYNVCILAYGQTGSGKTFTMTGTPENPGVNRRAIRELLGFVNANIGNIDFTITVSLMEIYNENIFDLLSSSRENKLSIHQGPNGVYVGDLTSITIQTEADIDRLMALGDSNRSVAATSMNSSSSRSHAILQLMVTGYNKISKVTTFGKLSLVDLAGSERVSKSDATGQRLTEAAAINKSLSSLGQVFKALAENTPHIPYRNSKLTHVLQDSLGGDSKTCVFVNISPSEYNLSESTCTINFGRNIRKIELGPAKKNKATIGAPAPGPKGMKMNINDSE